MASSSTSNNKSSTPGRLTNNYFFYGTHPLKVPSDINHSNSTNNISSKYEQTTQHLSLLNDSLSISEKSTTQSLNNIPKSYVNDEDSNEVINLKKKRLRKFIFLSRFSKMQ